ncbi:unnamed protein product [Periconia digitata]|uniref:Uncharacterized protein n=1 Tax=Periconia digitata TaxID=1303443 RepID=A0A9W4UP42_9PLEO|nr:unnamed protein product [Periconia digitata]
MRLVYISSINNSAQTVPNFIHDLMDTTQLACIVHSILLVRFINPYLRSSEKSFECTLVDLPPYNLSMWNACVYAQNLPSHA